MSQPQWRKSSYSTAASDNCLEVLDGAVIKVRDSKLSESSPVLSFGDTQWADFVGFAKDQV
ncbi:DUF397 domain-containing protein [Streptomyces sp. NRRL S-241]|uniref:DUF397 domain-containing protein n=1 Tax=Streptomyces sp. NRRL S-241 TaxID=1463896 RepID=UPI0004C2065A|nr:DUF397 domain-containing protein [Streptomyces sp. NRRL S-241]